MTQQSRTAPQGTSISKHRLFPALVTLWFGALFGLGSLAVQSNLLETLVVSARIDRLIPAAAPPLGDTARILIALILTALGALLGAVIASRIARPGPEFSEQEDGTSPIEAPADQLSQDTHVEMGDAQPALARRRGSLAPFEDDGRDYPDFATLPGGAPQILNIAEIDFAVPAEIAGAVADGPAQTDDLEALDMVSLAGRLVNSLSNRRAQTDAAGALPANEAIISAEPEAAQHEAAIDIDAPQEAGSDQFEDDDEEAIDEDIGYSSLLDLSRAPERRQTFVRLEDEPAAAVIPEEPVVIFPGQAARAAAAVAPAQAGSEAGPGTQSGEGSLAAPAGIRRFGSLASPAQEQPSTEVHDQAEQDSAETERALRAALSSLQRMTGTA